MEIPQSIIAQMNQWRRDFHAHPEVGWTEFRTASKIAAYLEEQDIDILLGKEVISENRMGLPSQEQLQKSYERAIKEGADTKYASHFEGGYTGVVATIPGDLPGPTVAFRFDIDALPIFESIEKKHLPVAQGFSSLHDGEMHACGHDGHAAIGLALATILSQNRSSIEGVVKIIFQPAEESVRGAKSMVEAGVVEDVDYFLAMHIGTGVPENTVVCGADGFLATTKIDVEFSGIAAHAGAYPEEGRNALVAAAQAVIAMQGISRSSLGDSRINIGTLHAGSGRNVIADHAKLQLETRGINTAVNTYMYEEVIRITEGIAQMYGVTATHSIVGEANSASSSERLVTLLTEAANKSGIETVIPRENFAAGSEDATYFMEAVQEQGGYASYSVFGTELAAGHHHEAFDFKENVMEQALHVLTSALLTIYQKERE